MERITSFELDNELRGGLPAIGAAARGEADAATVNRAEFVLTGIRGSTQRMGAENNELSNVLRLAKFSNAKPEDVAPIFQSIAARYAMIAAPLPAIAQGAKRK